MVAQNFKEPWFTRSLPVEELVELSESLSPKIPKFFDSWGAHSIAAIRVMNKSHRFSWA